MFLAREDLMEGIENMLSNLLIEGGLLISPLLFALRIVFYVCMVSLALSSVIIYGCRQS